MEPSRQLSQLCSTELGIAVNVCKRPVRKQQGGSRKAGCKPVTCKTWNVEYGMKYELDYQYNNKLPCMLVTILVHRHY